MHYIYSMLMEENLSPVPSAQLLAIFLLQTAFSSLLQNLFASTLGQRRREKKK
jgi:hypothetical protein